MEKHQSEATIQLTVTDMNDNWPEFDQSAYFATITENSVKDTLVTTVTVSLILLDTGTSLW